MSRKLRLRQKIGFRRSLSNRNQCIDYMIGISVMKELMMIGLWVICEKNLIV